jgi:hypothetical protein
MWADVHARGLAVWVGGRTERVVTLRVPRVAVGSVRSEAREFMMV